MSEIREDGRDQDNTGRQLGKVRGLGFGGRNTEKRNFGWENRRHA